MKLSILANAYKNVFFKKKLWTFRFTLQRLPHIIYPENVIKRYWKVFNLARNAPKTYFVKNYFKVLSLKTIIFKCFFYFKMNCIRNYYFLIHIYVYILVFNNWICWRVLNLLNNFWHLDKEFIFIWLNKTIQVHNVNSNTLQKK